MRELREGARHERVGRVREAAPQIDGVVLVEKLSARKSGSGYWVDMHLHVAPELTVGVAHALAGRVKAHICRTLPRISHVLIHIEPADAPARAN